MAIILSDAQKKSHIAKLAEVLAMLRAKANITQEELSNLLGISRQTYCAIETGQKSMSWSAYMSIVCVYDMMPETSEIMRKLEVYPNDLADHLNAKRL